MLLATYYAQNYAGIIGWSLIKDVNHSYITDSQLASLILTKPQLIYVLCTTYSCIVVTMLNALSDINTCFFFELYIRWRIGI